MTAHESFTHAPEFEQSTNTNFGYTFAGVFAVLAFWNTLWHGAPPHPWLLVVACVFALVTLWAPQWLAPLNKAWFWVSVILGKVMIPLTMLPIYVLAVVPVGVVMKLFGANPLRLGFDRHAATYWITRTPDSRSDMIDQF